MKIFRLDIHTHVHTRVCACMHICLLTIKSSQTFCGAIVNQIILRDWVAGEKIYVCGSIVILDASMYQSYFD